MSRWPWKNWRREGQSQKTSFGYVWQRGAIAAHIAASAVPILVFAAVMVHDFGELARAARLAQVEADRVALSAAMDLDWLSFRRIDNLQRVQLRPAGETTPLGRSISGVDIVCSWIVTGDKLQQVEATCQATPPTRFLALLGWSGASVTARSEAIFLYGIDEPLNDRLP